jgi:fructose-1,6-bisphosphatase/sedoheptulose 1,7-bisphosphatase-like protein
MVSEQSSGDAIARDLADWEAALREVADAGAQVIADGDVFCTVSVCTVRDGPSVSKDIATCKLQPGESVLVVEQLQCEGHLLGRISATEWVSIHTERGNRLLAGSYAGCVVRG